MDIVRLRAEAALLSSTVKVAKAGERLGGDSESRTLGNAFGLGGGFATREHK